MILRDRITCYQAVINKLEIELILTFYILEEIGNLEVKGKRFFCCIVDENDKIFV